MSSERNSLEYFLCKCLFSVRLLEIDLISSLSGVRRFFRFYLFVYFRYGAPKAYEKAFLSSRSDAQEDSQAIVAVFT